MTWLIYLLVGIMLTLGGCYCCAQGCSRCNDGSDVATIQIDLGGMASDYDTAGCCTTLNKSYILSIDPSNPCRFSILYENGNCETTDCNDCDDTGCLVGCDEGPATPCNPEVPAALHCSEVGDVTYGTGCASCAVTETGAINFPEGNNLDSVCVCTCEPSGLFWDVDLMLADYPEVDWAEPFDEIYFCSCTALDCTAAVSKSDVLLDATLTLNGGDVKLALTGRILTRTLNGQKIFTGDPIACATEMNALALTIGATGSGSDIEVADCASAASPVQCLCTIPTSCTVTYTP